MESLQEQIEYGSYCVHGTALGTPGGADLMCGLCEEGWTWWVESPRYGLFIETASTRGITGALVEWSDPEAADDQYLADIERNIRYWADEVAETPDPHDFQFVVKRTRSGYWDDPPRDAASHEAAGHEIPVNGAEGYCLTCYRDLDDRESLEQRCERLMLERLDTIEDIEASFDLTDDEIEGYAQERRLIAIAKVAGLSSHAEVTRYAEALIEQEDANIASWNI